MTSARTGLIAGMASFAIGLLVAGCGSNADSDTASDPTQEPSSPVSTPSTSETPDPASAAPACADVWQAEAKLPSAYKGCNEEGDGASEFVKRYVLKCSSGQRIVTYDDHYWAVLGGTIHRTESRLVKDPEYGDAVARCRG